MAILNAMWTEAFLAGAVEHSSMQEQVATEAERDTVDLKRLNTWFHL